MDRTARRRLLVYRQGLVWHLCCLLPLAMFRSDVQVAFLERRFITLSGVLTCQNVTLLYLLRYTGRRAVPCCLCIRTPGDTRCTVVLDLDDNDWVENTI